MSLQMHVVKKRLVRLVIAGGLCTGAVGLPLLLTGGTAEAATACGSGPIPAGTVCTLTGTLTLLPGALTLTSPSALAWAGTEAGLDLNLVDTTPAHQSYSVVDATGLGLGWHVTASATTFTSTSPAATLSDTGTFSTNGSTGMIGSTSAPTPACASGASCTLPTNTTTYPVPITTGPMTPTASTIYDTSIGTGLGSLTVGLGTNPVGWWLNVPSNVKLATPGSTTYTSTVTMQIISGP